MSQPHPYEAVVVGAGAAGCVVAARLAASGSRSVLLIEAGPDLRVRTPAHLRDGWHITHDFDWGYRSEPDQRGDVVNVWRHRLVGGTSWATRFAPRGHPTDYDDWAALGNAGWAFADVLPYFRRLESDVDFGDRAWHGADGPVPVTRYVDRAYTDVGMAGVLAVEASGFPRVEDHNRPGSIGAGRMPMSSRDGVRVTTADAYLPVGRTPANLEIRAETHVAEVVFDGERAAGVRLLDGTVIDAGWVVLSAGAYGSPAILLRSGIGPAAHLRDVGVAVRADLGGVGANLADHPAVDVDCGYEGAGCATPLHVIATFNSNGAADDSPPDLMLWLSDPEGEPAAYEIAVVLLKPRSRGTVRLRSADPAQAPVIRLPSLTDPSDVERLAEGLRRALEVARRPELRRHCAGPLTPAPRDDLHDVVRGTAYSLPHVVGTCAMGPQPGDGAVVDADGRVHGTHRLSVVDASIMPTVPSGFVHMPTIMLAERLSERIASQL